MPEINDNSVDCIITSPPYWGLRDYGIADQIGLEPTLKEYLDKMLIVTAECKRVLKPTGVLWWNHGDSYNSAGTKMSRNWDHKGNKDFRGKLKMDIEQSIPVKCLILQNYRLILRLIDEQGWILRNTVIWSKPNGMPSSVKDRLANKYESVFMLVKNKKYWFDLDAIREKYTKPLDRWGGDKLKAQGTSTWDNGTGQTTYRDRDMRPNKSGKNPGDVWSISTQPYPEAHFATFPEKLIIKPILSSCPEWICKKCGKARVRIKQPTIEYAKKLKKGSGYFENYAKAGRKTNPHTIAEYQTIGWTDCGCNAGWRAGIILDPFAGSGTTLVMVHKYNRQYIGYELNPDYIKLINKRLKAEKTLWDIKSE